LRQRDGAIPGPRQCDMIAAGSLQLTAQLLRGRKRDGLFQRPSCADGAGIRPPWPGSMTIKGRLARLFPGRTFAVAACFFDLAGRACATIVRTDVLAFAR
jgi:hypothetical protein